MWFVRVKSAAYYFTQYNYNEIVTAFFTTFEHRCLHVPFSRGHIDTIRLFERGGVVLLQTL